MRKIELKMNEEYKYEMTNQLSETYSNKKAFAIKVNCTIRPVNRLLMKYKLEGTSSFLHGNRDKKPSTTIHNFIKQRIMDLSIDDFC